MPLTHLTKSLFPIWVADYVLAGYGTGVVMAVPSSDDRDFRFAKHFELPVRLVIDGTQDMEDPTEKETWDHDQFWHFGRDGFKKMRHKKRSSMLKRNVLVRPKSISKCVMPYLAASVIGEKPVPAYFKDDPPLPHRRKKSCPWSCRPIDQYRPTETGEPPLGRAKDWTYKGYPIELTTMPGWAASSWYFLRYMDPGNDQAFAQKEVIDYWGQVDLYLGGTEHATGHLLYSRFWNMFPF